MKKIIAVILICMIVFSSAEGMRFDGYNIEEGEAGLNAFRNEMAKIRDDYIIAFNEFNARLSEVWYGENAVKYEEKLDEMLDVAREIDRVTNNIIVTCNLALSVNALHYDDIDYDENSIEVLPYGVEYKISTNMLPVNPISGKHGINLKEAEWIIDAFKKTCEETKNRIAKVEVKTGIIDATNTFEGLIEKVRQETMIAEVTKVINEIDSNLTIAISNEDEELSFIVEESLRLLNENSDKGK